MADACDLIMGLAKRSNKYIDETTPWTLAKDEAKKPRLGTVLYNLLESIRFIAVMIKPIMPKTSDSIFAQINSSDNTWESLAVFGLTKSGDSVGEAAPLFSRIDENKMLAEIEASSKTEEKTEDENLASIDDFAKLDIRAGKVLESSYVEGSDKLLVSKIDIGSRVLQVVSGIAKYYSPEDFVGKTVAVIANLKPVKLRGVLSEGMVIAAGDKKNLSLMTFDKEVAPGTKIS